MLNIIQIIALAIKKNQDNLINFFAQQFKTNSAIFYSSLDIRRSDFKIAPVDANCFPAGFNNLSKQGFVEAKKVLDVFFKQQRFDKILIITENHSRNLHYFENLAVLQHLLADYGKVFLGNWQLDKKQEFSINLSNINLTTNLEKDGEDKIAVDKLTNTFKLISSEKIDSCQFEYYKRLA